MASRSGARSRSGRRGWSWMWTRPPRAPSCPAPCTTPGPARLRFASGRSARPQSAGLSQTRRRPGSSWSTRSDCRADCQSRNTSPGRSCRMHSSGPPPSSPACPCYRWARCGTSSSLTGRAPPDAPGTHPGQGRRPSQAGTWPTTSPRPDPSQTSSFRPSCTRTANCRWGLGTACWCCASRRRHAWMCQTR
eukprot:scaffold4851_cov126-Isochrysis_galbana.AAC.6